MENHNSQNIIPEPVVNEQQCQIYSIQIYFATFNGRQVNEASAY